MLQTLYLWVCAVSSIAAAVLAFMAWQRRAAAPAAVPLTWFFVAIATWDSCYAFYDGIERSQTVMAFMYAGVAATSPSIFVFVARLGRFDWVLNRFTIATLTACSGFITFAGVTDARFGLLFHGFTGTDNYLRAHAGPAFWVNIAYGYTLMCATTAMVFVFLHRNGHHLYRRQFRALLAAVLVPWVGSFGLVFNLTSNDITPLSLSITAMLFAAAMWRYRGLRVVPVARHFVLEHMSDAVIVLDDNDVVSDLNAAAAQMFQTDPRRLGQGIADIPRLAAALAHVDRSAGSKPTRVELDSPHGLQVVEITVDDLNDRKGRSPGSVVVVRDVTYRVRLERELEQLASTDALTGIANRRVFEERLALEHADALRSGLPLTLAGIDLDHLKQINDEGGHGAGDAALVRVARILKASVRGTDLAARIGGDEFALLLPNTSADAAYPILERILTALEAERLVDAPATVITVSVGLATMIGAELSVDELRTQADEALYQAKNTGRNRICTAVVA